MKAYEYPVTLGFRQTAMPWYGAGGKFGRFHRGIDYGTPVGVSVVLANIEIGKTGATGDISGAHLHVDRRPLGVSSSDHNSFIDPTGWWKIEGVVEDVGYYTGIGNMITIRSGNDIYRFMHLSKINVKKGDRIMASKNHVNKVFQKLLFRNADPGAVQTYAKHDALFVWNDVANSKERSNREAAIKKQTADLATIKKRLAEANKQLSARPTLAELQAYKDKVQKLEKQVSETPAIDEDAVLRSFFGRVADRIISFFK